MGFDGKDDARVAIPAGGPPQGFGALSTAQRGTPFSWWMERGKSNCSLARLGGFRMTKLGEQGSCYPTQAKLGWGTPFSWWIERGRSRLVRSQVPPPRGPGTWGTHFRGGGGSGRQPQILLPPRRDQDDNTIVRTERGQRDLRVNRSYFTFLHFSTIFTCRRSLTSVGNS